MRLSWMRRASGGTKKSLRREIAVVLAIKALVLYGLWAVFFSHPAVPDMTAGMAPGRVAAVLVAPAPAVRTNH